MGYGSSTWREWVLNKDQSEPILKKALDLGINFFDMADFYSLGECERVVGETLLSNVNRDDLVLASKVYYAMSDKPNDVGLSRKHILAAIEGSLKRIGTDYLDLYLIHGFDPDTPIEETMEAMHDVVKAGKARYIGASTMYAWQLAKMNAIAEKNNWTKFINMQCQYSLLYREEEREMMPLCENDKIAVSTFSPLARGMLSGANDIRTQTDGFTTEFFGDAIDLAIAERVKRVADYLGITSAEVAMAWVCQSSKVTTPLVGAQSIEQLETAIGTLDITLDTAHIDYLEALYRPKDIINDHNPVRRARAMPGDDNEPAPPISTSSNSTSSNSTSPSW
ncbi:aldo/keto reductase [Marinibactrum halimedae]|uniref:Aldo/keto reductase n=2 Tax=Marinibactrum halimedae TaxID=1444977 RepID=A0AA37WNH3_9GAMM|nr:aldo/keto reductase [Marinibactrum halimedae]